MKTRISEETWLDLKKLAKVEVTSEDPKHPMESALGICAGPGWMAAARGEQTIRLLFDSPVKLRRICVVFHEYTGNRTQEFVIGWSCDGGKTYREIVRQQFNFSSGATKEVEDYEVQLDQVTNLELRINPDINGGDSRASLETLRLA